MYAFQWQVLIANFIRRIIRLILRINRTNMSHIPVNGLTPCVNNERMMCGCREGRSALTDRPPIAAQTG